MQNFKKVKNFNGINKIQNASLIALKIRRISQFLDNKKKISVFHTNTNTNPDDGPNPSK